MGDLLRLELCPFCGSRDADGCTDFIRCNNCNAFGPTGRENWNQRRPSKAVRRLISKWREIQENLEAGKSDSYTSPHDAIGDLINELEEAVDVNDV